MQITKPFYLGVTEVTQEQYEKVMGKNPSWFSSTGDSATQVQGMDTSHFPVEQVSWGDAVEFCEKLSAKEGRGISSAYGSRVGVRMPGGHDDQVVLR